MGRSRTRTSRRSFMAFLTKLKPLVLVYDITSKFSLDEVISLKREVDKIDFPDNRSIILVGNKVDLAVRHREVDKKFAEGIAESWGCGFVEVSAKTATNIDIIFKTLVTAYFKTYENVCSTKKKKKCYQNRSFRKKRNTNKCCCFIM